MKNSIYSKYYGRTVITISGKVKKFNKVEDYSISFFNGDFIEEEGIAKSQEEFENYLIKKAKETVENWVWQLVERKQLNPKAGIIIAGYEVGRERFEWSKKFINFNKFSISTQRIKKAYDMKDRTVAECSRELTPAQFYEEFGCLFNK